MAIYLDYQAKEPEILIKLIEESKLAPWVKKTLLGKITTDIARRENIDTCAHVFGTYKGTRSCCTHCGALGEGMGEEWIFENKIDE